jgi:DNA-binding PadR family transcriptional regulator
MVSDARVASHLPLSEVAFEIILALAEGERHGYAIMNDVADRTGGRVRLHPGTLYRALNRMLADGLVEETNERPAPEFDDERRRYYTLTPLGRKVAAAAAVRMADQVSAARAKRLVSSRELAG